MLPPEWEQQEWSNRVRLQTHLEGGVCKTSDQMGVGCKRRGGLWHLRHEEGEGQGLHILSWGRWWMSV